MLRLVFDQSGSSTMGMCLVRRWRTRFITRSLEVNQNMYGMPKLKKNQAYI